MNQGNNVQQWLLKSTNADHTEGVREGEGGGGINYYHHLAVCTLSSFALTITRNVIFK